MSSTSVVAELPTLEGVGDPALLRLLVFVVERLGRQELGGAVGDAALTGSVGVLHRVETMVAAEKLRRLAEVDARAAYVSEGMRSTADLLGGLGLTRGEARSQAQTAAALAKLPAMADGLARGQLGVGQGAVAARALDELPVTGDLEADRAAVGELDALVSSEGPSQDRRQLGRTVEEWAHRRDGDRLAERERRAHLRRHLWAGRNANGEPLIEGRLTPLVLAKLGAVLDPLARRAGADDDRTFGQRRHDALETVLDRAAAVTDRHPEPEPDGHEGHARPVATCITSAGGPTAGRLPSTTSASCAPRATPTFTTSDGPSGGPAPGSRHAHRRTGCVMSAEAEMREGLRFGPTRRGRRRFPSDTAGSPRV